MVVRLFCSLPFVHHYGEFPNTALCRWGHKAPPVCQQFHQSDVHGVTLQATQTAKTCSTELNNWPTSSLDSLQDRPICQWDCLIAAGTAVKLSINQLGNPVCKRTEGQWIKQNKIASPIAKKATFECFVHNRSTSNAKLQVGYFPGNILKVLQYKLLRISKQCDNTERY